MKKVFALMLCLSTVFGMCSCSKKEGSLNPKEEREAQAITVVSNFFNNIRSGNPGEYEMYFKQDNDCRRVYDIFSDFSDEAVGVITLLGVGDEEKRDELSESVSQKMFGAVDYTIDFVTSEHNEAEVSVTAMRPDFTDEKISAMINIDDLLDEAFGVDVSNSTELSKMLSEKKGIDIPPETIDIYSTYAFSDELSKYYNLVIDTIFDNPPLKTVKLQFEVEKTFGGDWKITDVDIH